MAEREPVVLTPEEIAFLDGRREIQAIKSYRNRTGCGLKEAKDAIDTWVYARGAKARVEGNQRACLQGSARDLLEALRPLAAWAALRPDGADDNERILHAAGTWPITWGDATRAAAAIAKAEGRHVP